MARSRHVALALALSALLAACGGFVTTLPTGAPTASPTISPEVPAPAPLDRDAIRADLDAFQRIADENGGIRAVGTPGYDASVAFVRSALAPTGARVSTHAFDMPVFLSDGPAEVVLAASGERFGGDDQVKAMLFSPGGSVEGRVVPVALDVGGPGSGGGCEASDYAGFPAGGVALVQPGPCFRRDQVLAAQEAGAAALILYRPSPEGAVLRSTLVEPEGLEIPAVSVARTVGARLADAAGETVQVVARTRVETATVENVIADFPGTDPERVVMLGGHLDSVIDGPGIQDNGSGVAMVLAIARAIAGTTHEATVRLGFWAGEELGLWGSTAYVESLGPAERASIEAYLNFDMVGSPNWGRWVYDDENAPAGSEAITAAFLDHFAALGLDVGTVEVRGRSDHAAFQSAGIATGGLFTGAEGIKTAQEARRFGGTAGEPYDGCYHLACDRADRVNLDVLLEMAEAALAVTVDLAVVDLPASMEA